MKKVKDGIQISMEDYAKSLEEIQIRDAKADEMLTRDELKVLRKYIGKLSWLAANTRPDLAIYMLELAKRQKKATIKDLRDVNRVLKKVKGKESKVLFTRIGEKDELCVIGVSDASYHYDDRSVAGEIIMLGSKKTENAAPLYWRSGVIRKVCISPKAAETRSLLRLMNGCIHMAKQLSQLLNARIRTRLFTVLRPLLESLGSSGHTDEKVLRQSVSYLRQGLEDEEVLAYSWIPGEEIVADILTKQGSKCEELEEIL